MKRLVSLLILLLSVILIAYAESNRLVPAITAAPVSQKEISAKLDELDARAADLQEKLNLSYAILKKRGQI